MKTLWMTLALAAMVMAADYGHMSTEEMMHMRGNVPVEERAEFREEMQKRMQHMTPQERKKYQKSSPGMMQGNGKCGEGNSQQRKQKNSKCGDSSNQDMRQRGGKCGTGR
ncbi:MAG: DUF1104 domain-containing protein [Campylobacterota bacterium]